MLIFKKEKRVRKLVLSHLADVQESLMEARNCLEEYLSGNKEGARARADQVLEIERRADVLEGEIREALLEGAFLPNVRSDVYRVVEAVDAIAGKGEEVSRLLMGQAPSIPEGYESDLLEIYTQCLNCFGELRKALKKHFKPKGKLELLHDHVAEVCDIESRIDRLMSALTARIFSSELELGAKLQLNGLVELIGSIADLSEDAADELEFAAMKSVT